jgi:FAD/FMN-containing dehydrogenase
MPDQIERALRQLSGQLPGRVSRPGEDGYDAATAIWAKPVGRMPRAVIHCGTTEDVQLAIRTAGDCGLPLSVRGGGHDWAGRALCAGIVIDLSGMNGVSVDADLRSAIISGGALCRRDGSDGSASRRGRDGHVQRRRHDRGRGNWP